MDPANCCRAGEPNLTIFHCDRCCGSAWSGPATANCRLVSCCTGEVGGDLIGDAFAAGAAGVLILGCLGSHCQSPQDDRTALMRIHESALAMHRLGVEPARLQRHWLTPHESARVPALVAAFRRRVAALGNLHDQRAQAPLTMPSPEPESAAAGI
jgi:coenzyme F420-reducing hydrogenase delta subunit